MKEAQNLESRIRRLEDRAEILQLLGSYSIACDLRDMDGLVNCFAPDGSFEAVAGKITGAEELRAYYAERFSQYGPTYHIPHSLVLEFDDDDHAHGVVLAHSEIMMENGFFTAAHHYHDSYVRCPDSVWRLGSRTNRFLYGMPLRELIGLNWHQERRRWPGAAPIEADIPEGTATWKSFRASIGRS